MSRLVWASVAAAILGVTATGCSTQAYCYRDCAGQASADSGFGSKEGGGLPGEGGLVTDGGTDGYVLGIPDAQTDCGVEEICDGVDNNCDGQIDEGFDFTDVRRCGTCDNDCIALLTGAEPTSISCVPPPTDQLGKVPGSCTFTQCTQDWYNADKDDEPSDIPGCEYYCPWNPTGANTTDGSGTNGFGCGKDDDCDGQIDEDVDTCSVTDCGKCGNNCVIAHGTPKCATTAAQGEACTPDNSECAIAKCDTDYYDLDKRVDNGCEYHCTPKAPGPEVCDGEDNDCDGKIDNEDPDLDSGDATKGDARVGQSCFGGTTGDCIDPSHEGVNKCIRNAQGVTDVLCCDTGSNDVNGSDPKFPLTGLRNNVCTAPTAPHVLHLNDNPETCDGRDNDCDGTPDDNPTDVGQACGESKGSCTQGKEVCVDGKPVCQGGITAASTDLCNFADEDCDGVLDGTLPDPNSPQTCTTDGDCPSGQLCVQYEQGGTVCAKPAADVGGACQVWPTPPCRLASGAPADCNATGASPAPQPCKSGIEGCVNGARTCVGAMAPPAAIDKCGEDTNCNGVLDNQPSLLTDPNNCGACGKVCGSSTDNAIWACQLGVCKAVGCKTGFIDCNNDGVCETPCLYAGPEQCNGVDDDCNCQVDEASALTKVPSPTQTCGVSQFATDAECRAYSSTNTSGVKVQCSGGQWKCTFSSTSYCPGGDCTTAADACDGKDNNCNGIADEGFKQPQRTSRYVGEVCHSDDGKPPPGDGDCRGTGTYVCTADGTDTVCNAKFVDNPQPELCDGRDNDCDGLVDESYLDKGPNATYFVKPAVVDLGNSTWMFQYEASRPNATATNSGTGNGYHTSAPSGQTLDATLACSTEGHLPWFNVSPEEAEQTCAAIGGYVCTTTDWETACLAGSSCKWGYGTNCTSGADYINGPLCNLHPFDTDTSAAGIQDAVIPSASPLLDGCYANWTTPLYDLTGNLREITANGSFYTLMGGAFSTEVEAGAACDFQFFSVDSAFKLYDTGFRCCFTSDPTQ